MIEVARGVVVVVVEGASLASVWEWGQLLVDGRTGTPSPCCYHSCQLSSSGVCCTGDGRPVTQAGSTRISGMTGLLGTGK